MRPAPFVFPHSSFGIPGRITASATPPAPREKWFTIKAAATGAELRLRGYIGEATKYLNWNGDEIETGGMGTLNEFEAALLALGDVPLITVYLTSEGGDFPTAVAISSILARQTARIVCVIDGYCYSAAPVIACAADEIRAASNALLMIHDAEFWCDGRDVASLQEAIKTLEACNTSMAAAFAGKAGGTPDEWLARMVATTWMTGAQAHELNLVDTLLDEVALSAYQPLKRVTAHYQPPQEITALIAQSTINSQPSTSPTIDTSPVSSPASIMKPTPELITAAAAFGITLTAASSEADVAAALTKISAAAKPADKPGAAPVVVPPVDVVTAADVKKEVTAAVKPLEDKITAQEKEIAHLKGVQAHGLGKTETSPTAAAATPVTGAAKTEDDKKTSNLGLVTGAWKPASQK